VVEADKCGHHCGKQDQYAAAFGGLNYITFQKRSVKVTPILKGIEWYDDFERHALLLWTGIARKNEHTQILERQAKAFRDGTNANYGVVVAQQAAAFHTAIVLDESMEKLGKLLDDAWKVKRYLVDGIANEIIDRYYDVAMRHGAYGGKLLGAGGGGFIFLLAPPDMHETICNRTGLPKIDFKIEPNGSEVIYETQDVVRR
jgi:D-glycero-alpha-D-manno-heptose-7-phosphate kinase